MRGYLNHFAAAAVVFVLCATAVLAQNSQEKKPQEKTTQDKTTQEKNSLEKSVQEQDTQSQSSGKSDAWYNKVNPIRLFKHYKSANDQLASDGHLEDKLSKQLRIQGVLGADRELQDVCSEFKDLPNCVAVLRLSVSLPVEFTCLKWNVTGAKPKNGADSCAGPAGGKAMPLDRALGLLKPNLDVKKESSNALRKAHGDIKDASS
ncbi:MAG TPA: hypothetical protein VE778_01460 [Candidatus Bathyarchaeia archaeon]|jgi:hypothetical protein|nr:hypothetical protein [Candidatus Bathyarchaeia archaeon]